MGLLMSDQGGVWGSGESSSSDHHERLSPSCRRNSHSLIIVEPYCSNLCTAHQDHLTLVSCRLTLHRLLRPRSSVFLEPCLGLICIAEPSSPESVIRTQHLVQKDTQAYKVEKEWIPIQTYTRQRRRWKWAVFRTNKHDPRWNHHNRPSSLPPPRHTSKPLRLLTVVSNSHGHNSSTRVPIPYRRHRSRCPPPPSFARRLPSR